MLVCFVQDWKTIFFHFPDETGAEGTAVLESVKISFIKELMDTGENVSEMLGEKGAGLERGFINSQNCV